MKSELLDFTNHGFLAVTELDSKGNIVFAWDFKIPSMGTKRTASREETDIAVNAIVQWAAFVQKPIAKENLDFSKKKNKLKKGRKSQGKKYNKMLTTFSYAAVDKALERACAKHGVELIRVNPRNTSKSAKLYVDEMKLSVHQAAAWCIGRRAMGFKLRLKKSSKQEAMEAEKKRKKKEAEKAAKKAARDAEKAAKKAEKERIKAILVKTKQARRDYLKEMKKKTSVLNEEQTRRAKKGLPLLDEAAYWWLDGLKVEEGKLTEEEFCRLLQEKEERDKANGIDYACKLSPVLLPVKLSDWKEMEALAEQNEIALEELLGEEFFQADEVIEADEGKSNLPDSHREETAAAVNADSAAEAAKTAVKQKEKTSRTRNSKKSARDEKIDHHSDTTEKQCVKTDRELTEEECEVLGLIYPVLNGTGSKDKASV